jgi:hypothetical protein
MARRDGSQIFIGPGASDDQIATIACRCMLQTELGDEPTEEELSERIALYGFQLSESESVPLGSVRSVSPAMRARKDRIG